MCGFAGFANLNKDISNDTYIIKGMNSKIQKRGPDEEGYYTDININLAHRRLAIIDKENGKQPMSVKFNDTTYTIVYNGQIYNKDEIKKELKELGYEFNGYSDTEVLLKGYIHFGENILKKLNGIFSFAIWNNKKKELFMARDQFGIKPLYYTIIDDTIIFASEIKVILKYPNIEVKINKQGIGELFGLGPAHTPGISVFKNIHELKPAHFMVFNKSGIHIEEYWELESKEHKDSFGTTCEKIRFLLEDSISKQLVSDVPICTMLSGGLDSSIITAYASNYYKQKGMHKLDTFSVDYVDNDKNFVKSDFQPNSDKYYIDIMRKKFDTNHHEVVIDTPELADTLDDAMEARDYPGMADVDSSLLLFCREISKDVKVAISRRMC